jgi:hypothetical protein
MTGAETDGEKNLQESFFGDMGGKGSGRQVNGTDGRKNERKYKENQRKMTMFQDEKQGAITPPKNQSPEFNVKVAHKM